MKRKAFSLVSLFFILSATGLWSADESQINNANAEIQRSITSATMRRNDLGLQKEKKITGEDWILMSTDEKNTAILIAMESLKARGVPLQNISEEYRAMIDLNITDNPVALKKEITNILATVVYQHEPESRQMLDHLRVKPKVRKMEMH